MNKKKLDYDDLKKNTRILDVVTSYGIKTREQGRQHVALCPFHSEKEPSFVITPDKNLWHCFGCDKGGSVIDFVMEMEQLPFKEAVEKMLLTNNGGTVIRASQLKQKPKTVKAYSCGPATVQAVCDHYRKTLLSSEKAMNYLKSRCLADPETLIAFNVGYVDGSLKKVLPSKSINGLKYVGVLNEKGNEAFYGRIVMPVLLDTGTFGEMYGRHIEQNEKYCDHLYLPGVHQGVMNPKAFEVYDEMILTEAPLDALSLYSIRHRNVSACYGADGLAPDHYHALERGKVRKVYLAFDNDQTGLDATARYALSLESEGYECHRINIPDMEGKVKDCNDYVRYLHARGMSTEEIKSSFAGLIRKAPRIGYRRENRKHRLKLIEQTETDLVFKNFSLSYRVRGLYDNNPNSLRVILTVTCEGATHTDRFDLYTAKTRVSFAHRAANRLEIPAAKIEEDLNVLIPMLETLSAEGSSNAAKKNELPPMSEKERKEALRLLRSPNLMQRIAADLETVGYVGEERNKQLVYLVATSRKLDKPLSAIIRSESGAGKSYLMECVAELMPPEDVKYFSRLTPQSLYYMEKNELVHKLLIVDERDGSEESEYPIRTLQTRRKLTLAVPMKDAATGKIRTVLLEIMGPIAYMESSTQQNINPENLNRCFEIYLDSTESQTRRIMIMQRKARTLSGLALDSKREQTLRLHHNAQRLLRPLKVVIPFARHLDFPAQWIRTRRDHERFLSLLEIITFLHQHQRTVKKTEDGVEYIEATEQDYTMTYNLAKAVFDHSLNDLAKPARELHDAIINMVETHIKKHDIARRDYWFTRRNVREFTKWPDHQIKRTIRQLEDLEYLEIRRAGQGGSFKYRLPAQNTVPAFFEGLTTPENLKKALKKAKI